MDEAFAKSILMKLKVGEYVEKNWLINHTGCSTSLLGEMIEAGWLTKKHKNPFDFMSDDRYALTEVGQEYAWR